MSRLTYDDICNLICLEVGGNSTPNSVKRYLKATYKVILSQLSLNDEIHFSNFGTFEIKDRKSGERVIGNPEDGGKQLVYVKPKKSITFKPSQIFDISVNENNFKIAKNIKKREKSRREKSFGKTIVNAFNKATERSK